MIYIGADHRGYNLKEKIKNWLKEYGYEFEDLGNREYDPQDDYPDWALAVARAVANNKQQTTKGIIICGSGVGVDMVANKVRGVRCGLGFDPEQIRLTREHDNINCLALAADFLTEEQAKEMVKIFLETEFSGEERHLRRIGKIHEQETT